MRKNFVFVFITMAVIFSACKKTEEYKTVSISDYYPLVVGKYITYQLDSLIFADNITPFDRVISYQVKHLVQDTTTDNLGRKGFVIRRYIRKTPSDSWVVDNSFTAINTGKSLEFIENNYRFLKLEEPIKNGFSWKGNSYIDTYSQYPDVKYLDNWDYVYDSLNTPLKLPLLNVDSSLKVYEDDDKEGFFTDSTIHTTTFSVSNYGRGIGMVYHKFLYEEYQPPTPYNTGDYGYKIGYGITLTMIDHN